MVSFGNTDSQHLSYVVESDSPDIMTHPFLLHYYNNISMGNRCPTDMSDELLSRRIVEGTSKIRDTRIVQSSHPR
jgi:hypothetical protein